MENENDDLISIRAKFVIVSVLLFIGILNTYFLNNRVKELENRIQKVEQKVIK